MDVNGTRFHLFRGESDWRRCTEPGSGDGWADLAWDDRTAALTLRPLLSIFPRGRRDHALLAEARRGAAVDRFGNVYWISQDRQRIYWQPTGDVRPSVYWQLPAEPPQPPADEFRPIPPPLPLGEGRGEGEGEEWDGTRRRGAAAARSEAASRPKAGRRRSAASRCAGGPG